MTDRQPIQLVNVELPLWHKTVYQGPETIIMCRFSRYSPGKLS
jgi:hypothetical protein